MSDLIRVGHLRGIMMRAPNILETLPFYEDMWGLELAHRDTKTAYLRGSGEEAFLYGITDDDVYGIDYVHFGMEDTAAIDGLHAQICAKGYRPLGPPALFEDWVGGYGFDLADLDHRRLRFRCDTKMHSPYEAWAKPKKISHVVLNTPDMEKLQDFYTDVLGFRISDYSADQMVFLRCNNDHHSIALVRAHYPSVNHVAFEVPTLDEFMRAIGRMKQKGHVPSWGPGRHGPGNNPFAYFVSPSGFVIEFTSELLQIDEETHQAKIWSRTDPEAMDRWMIAGPPTSAQRAVMQGRPDPGFSDPGFAGPGFSGPGFADVKDI